MAESKKDIAFLLVEQKLITAEQLEDAYKVYTTKGGSFSDILINLGYINENDLIAFFSTYLSIPPIRVSNYKIAPEIIQLVPKEFVYKYMVLPLGSIGTTLTVAIADPLNFIILDDLAKITGYEINPVIAGRSELKQAMDLYYRETVTATIDEIIQKTTVESLEIIKEEKETEVKDEEILRSIDDAPVVKLTSYILKHAVEEKASDILVEPLTDQSRVRYRVDGVLYEVKRFPKSMHTFVVSRLKVIASLNITEHRLPQDGRFHITMVDRDVDFRVSVVPSSLGEKVALRILDKTTALLDLDYLGFDEDMNKIFKHDASKSYGMILVCGPTGSGKTTTLYSF